MIKLIRVDGRLIHGQVASSVLNQGGIDRCIVIDDRAAKDATTTKMLLMAASQSAVKTVVKTLDDAVKLIMDPRAKSMNILVVTATLDVVYKLIELCKEDIQAINIGNYGMVNKSTKPRKTYFKYCFMDEDEYELMRKIVNSGIHTYYQETGARPSVDVKTIF